MIIIVFHNVAIKFQAVGARSTVVELEMSMQVFVGSNPAQTELASAVVRS